MYQATTYSKGPTSYFAQETMFTKKFLVLGIYLYRNMRFWIKEIILYSHIKNIFVIGASLSELA